MALALESGMVRIGDQTWTTSPKRPLVVSRDAVTDVSGARRLRMSSPSCAGSTSRRGATVP